MFEERTKRDGSGREERASQLVSRGVRARARGERRTRENESVEEDRGVRPEDDVLEVHGSLLADVYGEHAVGGSARPWVRVENGDLRDRVPPASQRKGVSVSSFFGKEKDGDEDVTHLPDSKTKLPRSMLTAEKSRVS